MADSYKSPAQKATSRKRPANSRKPKDATPVPAAKTDAVAAAAVAKPAIATPVAKREVPATSSPSAVVAKIVADTTPAEAPAPVAMKPVEKAQVIVTNIVEAVDETIFQKGTAKMTNTTENFATQAKGAAETVASKAQALANNVTAQAKVLGGKSIKALAESGEFTKANAEAVVASSKIASKGLQDMGQSNIEFTKKTIEETSAAVKKFAAIKSPTEFFQLQGELIRKNLDDAVAQGSKNVEALLNLSNEAFQPISSRFAVIAEKIKAAA